MTNRTKEEWARFYESAKTRISTSALTINMLEDLTELFARATKLEADAMNAEAKGWRDAVSCLQHCEANWYQDCRSDVEREALQTATKNLIEELVHSSPSDWLGTEWKTTKALSEKIAILEAQLAKATGG